MNAYCSQNGCELIAGASYTVIFNGVEYNCTSCEMDMGDGFKAVGLGNLGAMDSLFLETEHPFVMIAFPDEVIEMTGCGIAIMPLEEVTSVNISIKNEVMIKIIDEKFLPPITSKMSNNNAIGTGYFSLNSSNDPGDNSVQVGTDCSASGTNAFAGGLASNANADTAFAFGNVARALGTSSFACGYHACSSDNCSHAEGSWTHARGEYSHAEGNSTDTNGEAAHAEGKNTEASNIAAHAEGTYTFAIGDSSHAEGAYTFAIGEKAHAEGYQAAAIGKYSHAEGYGERSELIYVIGDANATTYSVPSTAEYLWRLMSVGDRVIYFGENTEIAKEICFIVEVNKTDKTLTLDKTLSASAFNDRIMLLKEGAFGEYSHSEGCSTIASGYNSHAEGIQSVASGSSSHAEGTSNASGNCSHAEGASNASGDRSHAEGV